jgi:hypothetical protein
VITVVSSKWVIYFIEAHCMFENVTSSNSISVFISGASEPLQRWEMCVETLQRFMGFALATMQDQAMNEPDRNAATNVVSMI